MCILPLVWYPVNYLLRIKTSSPHGQRFCEFDLTKERLWTRFRSRAGKSGSTQKTWAQSQAEITVCCLFVIRQVRVV
jgi:hypothetical protein